MCVNIYVCINVYVHESQLTAKTFVWGRERMSGTFARGAHSMNSTFFKPMIRKAYHKKSSSADTLRESLKVDTEEVGSKSSFGDGGGDGSCWAPHERTGIFYPKGQEKVMESVPSSAGKDVGVNWFSDN